MKKYQLKFCFPILIFLILCKTTNGSLNNGLCSYLEPEVVAKILSKEIHSIGEAGSCNGINAILLNQYYKCPVFVFEMCDEYIETIKKNISTYSEIKQIDFNQLVNLASNKNIDLLCINDRVNCLEFLNDLSDYLPNIKYIIANKKLISSEVKFFLINRKFRCFFDSISLFDNVLFINDKVDKDFFDYIKNYNIPTIEALLPHSINSRLLHAAWLNDHKSFYDLNIFNGLNLNYQDKNGNTMLMAAVAQDSQYPIDILKKYQNLNFNIRNKNGCTALMIGAALGKACCVHQILEDCRCLEAINIKNNLGMTPEETARALRSSEIADYIRFKNSKIVEDLSNKNIYPSKVIPQKILICGTCRNVAKHLYETISIMEKIGELFNDYRVIISENNSTDNTKEILSQWVNMNPKVYVHMENLTPEDFSNIIINENDDGSFFKVDLIARGRNIVLDKIMTSEYDDFNYMLMMDMDFSTPPPAEAIIEVFQTDREWDAVFAYGVGRFGEYWDWYALRDFNQPLGPELLGAEWFCAKQWSLNRTDQWCRVYSAFGGLGIYKKSSIQGCQYSSIVTKDVEAVFKKIIKELKPSNHPIILKYLNDVKNFNKIKISNPQPNLPKYTDSNLGVILNDESDPLTWRMNSSVWQYPAVVDHVPFHASMIMRGHDKLFINPRLILEYTG